MSAHTAEKLAYMANQIARNLAHEPDPAEATARHIHAFWSPAMIAALRGADQPALPAVVAAALARLAAEPR